MISCKTLTINSDRDVKDENPWISGYFEAECSKQGVYYGENIPRNSRFPEKICNIPRATCNTSWKIIKNVKDF